MNVEVPFQLPAFLNKLPPAPTPGVTHAHGVNQADHNASADHQVPIVNTAQQVSSSAQIQQSPVSELTVPLTAQSSSVPVTLQAAVHLNVFFPSPPSVPENVAVSAPSDPSHPPPEDVKKRLADAYNSGYWVGRHSAQRLREAGPRAEQ
jgi:hypothetical protein